MIALLFAALAFAQDPPVEGDADVSFENGVLVVRVVGPDALAEARKVIVDDMAAQGWRLVGEEGGETVFRGPSNWMGRAILDEQGTIRFTTPAAAFQTVGVDDGSAGRDTPGTAPIGQEAPGGAYQGTSRDPGAEIVPTVGFAIAPRRKAGIVHDRVLAEVGPELAAYRDVLQQAAFQEQLRALPDRLDALWELGVPLEGGGPRVETIPARREALLTFWATRADNSEGATTCRAVELWLAEIVQKSADPVTVEEQEAANDRALHPRRLALVAAP